MDRSGRSPAFPVSRWKYHAAHEKFHKTDCKLWFRVLLSSLSSADFCGKFSRNDINDQVDQNDESNKYCGSAHGFVEGIGIHGKVIQMQSQGAPAIHDRGWQAMAAAQGYKENSSFADNSSYAQDDTGDDAGYGSR